MGFSFLGYAIVLKTKGNSLNLFRLGQWPTIPKMSPCPWRFKMTKLECIEYQKFKYLSPNLQNIGSQSNLIIACPIYRLKVGTLNLKFVNLFTMYILSRYTTSTFFYVWMKSQSIHYWQKERRHRFDDRIHQRLNCAQIEPIFVDSHVENHIKWHNLKKKDEVDQG